MKKLFILFSLFLLQNTVKAQVTRGFWEFGPVITTTNNGYGWVTENLKKSGFFELIDDGPNILNKNSWWIPSFRARFDILKDIDTPNGDVKVKWADWGLRNYSIGYHVGYLSYVSPIGFDVQVDYEKQNWRSKFPGQEDYMNYEKQMVVPTVLLKTRIGDFVTNAINVIVEAGAKYNYVLSAKGDYDDVESLNNGFTGVFGIGIINSFSHFAIELRYEHDFFDYFNKDFSPKGTFKPYEGYSSKHGTLNLYTSFGF
ncbi:MAG: hypothetical protein IJK42_06690 [Prevotella sp.]|nr:hypothetical protein [Prevotella sp.]